MPSKYDEQRFQAARLRLATHPALETAPKVPYDPPPSALLRPQLFSRLAAQYTDNNNTNISIDPPMLADRGVLAEVVRLPSLMADESWRAALANGCNNNNMLLMDREKLSHIVAAHPVSSFYCQPGADRVEQALACAVSAQISLAQTHQKCRDTAQVIEKEIAAKKAAEKIRIFPREWANLKPQLPSASQITITPPKATVSSPSTAQNDNGNETLIPSQPPSDVNKRSQEITAANKRTTRSAAIKAGAKCCFCPEGGRYDGNQGGETESELLGPYVNPRGKANLYVHFYCGCWAPQVFADPNTGVLRGVYDEYKRGRQLRCAGCKQKGATVGCYIEKCKKVFHYRCLEKAKARKVTDYFAAFCRQHAHLADKESYQLMMKAHTIADVAAAHRESTDGLDAPHSKYTKLRRRDTEIIFARKAGICSHNGCYEHGKSLFSTASRTIVEKNSSKKWKRSDGMRLIRNSTVNVANGYLESLVSGRSASNCANMEARKEENSRTTKPYSPLFLLRNLENSPDWTTDQIRIAKPARRRSVHFNVRMRKSGNRTVPMVKASKQSDTDSNDDAAKNWRPTRKKRTVSDVENSDGSDAIRSTRRRSSGKKHRKLNNGASVPLPKRKRPKNYRLSGTCRLQGTGPVAVDDVDQNNSLVNDGYGTVPSASPTSSTTHGNGFTGNNNTNIHSTPKKLRKRVHCGWDVFLDEQLPRERLVRPDDDMDVAMGNMARMWSLLSKEDRNTYEARATGKVKENIDAERTLKIRNQTHADLALPDGAQWADHQAAGLFAVKTATPLIARNSNSNLRRNKGDNDDDNYNMDPAVEIESKKYAIASNSDSLSVALGTSRNRRWRESARRTGNSNHNLEEPIDVDWDEMFPVDLTKASPSAVGNTNSAAKQYSHADDALRKGKGKGKGGVKKLSADRIRPPPRTRR